MPQTEPKLSYVVLIMRRDDQHITALEDHDFKKCKTLWTKLHKQWQECHKESTVFVIEKPLMSAFEPGMISEIKLIPRLEQEQMQVDASNPYMQQMQQQGLGSTLKNKNSIPDGSPYPDLLDGGFK